MDNFQIKFILDIKIPRILSHHSFMHEREKCFKTEVFYIGDYLILFF